MGDFPPYVKGYIRTRRQAGRFRGPVFPQCGKPFPGSLVGGLGIHVDEQFPFIHANQVIPRLSACKGGARMEFQYDRGSRKQKLPAPSGVFYMADNPPAPCFHMGDEAVGPAYEGSRNNMFIGHDDVPPGCIGPSLDTAAGKDPAVSGQAVSVYQIKDGKGRYPCLQLRLTGKYVNILVTLRIEKW